MGPRWKVMVHPEEPSKEARKRQIKVTALNFGKWKLLVLPEPSLQVEIQRINPQAVLNQITNSKKLGLIPLRTTHWGGFIISPPPPTTCKKIRTLKHFSTPGQKLGLSFTYCTNKSKYPRF
jgi:hypothetical protein